MSHYTLVTGGDTFTALHSQDVSIFPPPHPASPPGLFVWVNEYPYPRCKNKIPLGLGLELDWRFD